MSDGMTSTAHYAFSRLMHDHARLLLTPMASVRKTPTF